MPKETIHDQVNQFDLQIGWQPGKWVQVGVETHDGGSLARYLNADDGDDPATFTGIWGTFDRDGINRAIRMLRRARDSAFGKDE